MRRTAGSGVRRRGPAAAAAVTVGSLLLVGGSVPLGGTGEPGRYSALGDSYSSGLGTRDYLDDGTACRRSPSSYPSLLAATRGEVLDLRACAGATVPDVVAGQLSALSASTTRVTVSVGGNDAGFLQVLTECALPSWASDCDTAIDRAEAVVEGTLPTALDDLYARIRAAAPAAEVTAVGYPRLFTGQSCDLVTFLDPGEQTRLNAMADRLNAVTADRAAAAGLGFADPMEAFVGHAVCDEPAWVNGLSWPVGESYHPNTLGHLGYAGVVGGPVTPAGAALAASPQWAEELAATQRRHAATDPPVEPRLFRAPDLDSPQVRRAARAAGVDVADPASLAAGERRWSSVAEVEAVTGLDLD